MSERTEFILIAGLMALGPLVWLARLALPHAPTQHPTDTFTDQSAARLLAVQALAHPLEMQFGHSASKPAPRHYLGCKGVC